MHDKPSVEEMNHRFGDRFDGMRLTHIELLHWPVWRHSFRYTIYEGVTIDALEEGLLRLVQAGVHTVEEVAALLGCSVRYAREMSSRLARVQGAFCCLQISGEDELNSLPHTASVLELRERQIPSERTVYLLRDALYGNWLSYGDNTFDLTPLPTLEDGPYRWLGAEVSPDTSDPEAVEYALAALDEPEVSTMELGRTGDLQWVTLWLGCYQRPTGARGRYLLFNPADGDAPLLDLTVAFEQDLGRQPIKLYFADGPLRTSELFWQGIAQRVLSERTAEELESNKNHLTLVASEKERLRGESILASEGPSGTFENEAASGLSIEASEGEQPIRISEELLAAQLAVSAAETRVAALERQLADAPRIEHLEAREHPAILRGAIRQSRRLLILICPWIKIRVVRPLLPDIDAALMRGVHIFIGYGMPKSSFHPDKTDEEALDELRQRQSGQQLWLVHLGTHEKVIIQDDQLFVNTSFNFFSYTGGDGRRESGTLQRGAVAPIRDKFLSAFPDPVVQRVRELERIGS